MNNITTSALITQIENAALNLSEKLLQKQWRIACAESCTGGGLGFFLTQIAGSSRWFEGGFISYSNEFKMQQLNIPNPILSSVGAVSEETAKCMAQNTRLKTQCDMSISITGIAGPDGGSDDKPVGLVWFGLATSNSVLARAQIFSGDRTQIRLQSILFAIEWMLE